MSRAKKFVFTKNNYTEPDIEFLKGLFERPAEGDEVTYLVFGKEVAPTTGTPHLQGYIEWSKRKTLSVCRRLLSRCHIEIARGSPQQCAIYAKKDGDFLEFGTISKQGSRTDVESFMKWMREYDGYPPDVEIAENFPQYYFHNYNSVCRVRELYCSQVQLETPDDLRLWQSELEEILRDPPIDDRKILFYVDETGGTGKSFFIRYYLSKYKDGQMFGIGKRDDLAHAVDVTKRVFLINVPRENMQFLNYGFIEQLKDRMIFSPKYDSKTKKLIYKPHVVIFSNEYPDYAKLSEDRYEVIDSFNNSINS